VVFLIVKLERLLAHHRSQSVLLIRQWRNFEVHAVLPFFLRDTQRGAPPRFDISVTEPDLLAASAS
jgi:hypothetical protein